MGREINRERGGRELTRALRRTSALTMALLTVACAGATPSPASPESQKASASLRLADAADVLASVVGSASDARRIPKAVTDRATCVAVVPALVRGAVIVGAERGSGVVTCRVDGVAWSRPSFFTLSGGSAGLAIGVQSVDLVMIALSDRGKKAFVEEELRLGGEISATAGPEGRGRSEDTDPSLQSAIVSYSRSRGLFAGVDLSGAQVHADPDATRAFYGHDETPATTLLAVADPVPPGAEGFLARVKAAF